MVQNQSYGAKQELIKERVDRWGLGQYRTYPFRGSSSISF